MNNLFMKSIVGSALALAFATSAMAAPASITSSGGNVSATVNDSGTFSSLSYTGTEYVAWGTPMSYYWLESSVGSFLADNAGASNPLSAVTTGLGTASFSGSSGGLMFSQLITLTEKSAVVSVTLSNTTSAAITGVKWSVGIDPDQAIPTASTFDTANTIYGQGSSAGVNAKDIYSPFKQVTLRNTTSAAATAIEAYIGGSCCSPISPSSILAPGVQSPGFSNYGDYSINLAYSIGSIAAGNSATIGYEYIFTPVPEPETYAMLMAGLGLMGVVARRRKQQAGAV